ncbi:hypothetical protein O181_088385 [Austropuccinia psidii MF-1]|uniref:Uncharacterized protein n=1 Tax=Austropuccinia psidii MF-1 TaxID=1389203 RepID=A0A9Q3IRF1_9BASI|nr:hypothetical protein [Austropuccinia psidii MF-1]
MAAKRINMTNTNIHHDGLKSASSALESERLHSHPHPSMGPYESLQKKRILTNFTKTHPNFPRLSRKAHCNRPNMGEPQIQTPTTNHTSPTQ